MKLPQISLLTLASALLYSHASADVTYSNLLNTAIPLDFTGVTIGIGNGEINPFFGGFAVANDADLQPFRLGTGGLDTIRNFSHGTLINASNTSLATGPGGSQDHLGTTFTAGQEGYMGFKLDNQNYGWVRVLFTNNIGGALVKDWSYDNAGSGSSITVGGIRQVAQNIEISANFTLSSSLIDSGGVTNLIASNAGTTTLSANHTYTGTTTINSGSTLIINGATTTSGVTVAAAGTLGGIGTVGGATILAGTSIHSPGSAAATVGKQTFSSSVTYDSGSIFEWNLAATPSETGRGTSYDAVNAASLGVTSGAIFRVVLDGAQDFTSTFWDTSRTWSDIFKTADAGSNLSITSIFTGTTQYYNVTSGDLGAPTAQGSFSFSGSNLNWTPVPEPSSALAGLLLTAGLLRRRR